MVGFKLCSLDVSHADLWLRLLLYTPGATVVRLLTTNALIAYVTSWVLYLSGAAQDPRMLLPAWVSIAAVGELRHSVQVDADEFLLAVDADDAVPSDSAQYEYEEGNFGFYERLLYCQFHQPVLSPSTASSDKRKPSCDTRPCNGT